VRANYLEKSLAGVQKVMAEDMYQAGVAAGGGLLQRVNPRVKLVGGVLLLLAVVTATSLKALAAVHVLLAVTAVLSGIGVSRYLVRTWLPASIFAGIAVAPAMLSWITPGDALVLLYQGTGLTLGPIKLPAELAITRQGLTAAGLVLLRSAASLGVAVLLVKTTRWPVLTKALGALGLPGVVVMVLDLTYRYLFLFLLLLTDYLLGRKSRLVGVEGAQAKLNWIGGALAGFLRMAGEYSREITAAMLARGYDGENRQVLPGGFGVADACFVAAVAVICAVMWGGAQFGQILDF
jgi:cobalt/nickel transport system permease protein